MRVPTTTAVGSACGPFLGELDGSSALAIEASVAVVEEEDEETAAEAVKAEMMTAVAAVVHA